MINMSLLKSYIIEIFFSVTSKLHTFINSLKNLIAKYFKKLAISNFYFSKKIFNFYILHKNNYFIQQNISPKQQFLLNIFS